ncbi:MAG: PQQ-dependent sugar dehydrogenase [Gemmatimonadaceae bacterium]
MTGYVGPIETQTLKNAYFRQVPFTGPHSQLVVMCLQPGEEIGKEMHPAVDQFFRVEQGEGEFVLSGKEHMARDGDAVVVPAGMYHNVLNASKTAPLRLYTIYSPHTPLRICRTTTVRRSASTTTDAFRADHPFVGRAGALPEIWTYGHRNAQGLAVHPTTGDVWLHEHGPQGGDELNLLRPGLNYGLPLIGYGVNYRTGAAIHSGTAKEGIEPPMHVWVWC